MNCISNQLKTLYVTLEEDLLEIANLQTKLNSIRRNVQTRGNKEEIDELVERMKIFNTNIEETKQTISIIECSPISKPCTPRTACSIPKDLPQLRVAALGNKFDIQDFITIFESRLTSNNVPMESWSQILASSVPQEDLPTLYWIQENIIKCE